MDAVAPPPEEVEGDRPSYMHSQIRWESMVAEIWKGSLEVINEAFVGIQCIVSSEVYVFIRSSVSILTSVDKQNRTSRT